MLDIGTHLVQSELDKYFKLQDVGLDTNFKCPSCRNCPDCLRGAGKEKMTLIEEAQQQVIRNSVRIDKDLKRPVACLAFIKEPRDHLSDNSHIAKKRLLNVCNKYKNEPEVLQMINKGFKKLIDRGHIVPYEKLSPAQQKLLMILRPHTLSRGM